MSFCYITLYNRYICYITRYLCYITLRYITWHISSFNTFMPHFLMNGPKKKIENLFSENQILRHNYLILFLGNVKYLKFLTFY